jgi:hypothetical protein
MRIKLYIIAATLLAFSSGQVCSAQEIITGEIDYPHLGLSFTAPLGWKGTESAMGLVLGHDSIAGMILVAASETQQMDELKRLAQQGIHDENGTSLIINGAITDYSGAAIGAAYTGSMEYTPVSSYVIGMISPYKTGLAIMAIASQERFDSKYRMLAEEIMESVEFRAPDIAAITSGWHDYLSGYRLRRMSSSYDSGYNGSYTGHSTDVILDLCPDGSFSYQNNSSFSVSAGDAGGAYGASDGSSSGTWTIGASLAGNPTLELTFDNGEIGEHTISVDGEGKTYLNGGRVFRLSGQDGPNCR